MILQSSHRPIHILCVLIFNKFSHFPGRLYKRHFRADRKDFIHCAVSQWTVRHQSFVFGQQTIKHEGGSISACFVMALAVKTKIIMLYIHCHIGFDSLRASESIRNILIVFPVRGHSFLPAGCVFARVEKLLRKRPLTTTKIEYETIYSQVGNVNASGKDLKLHGVKSLSKVSQNVYGISDFKRISIQKHETKRSSVVMCVRVMTHYRFDRDTEHAVPILKRRK
ncbi:hypothetical protein PR048_018735, partial [Dryococelus australis]